MTALVPGQRLGRFTLLEKVAVGDRSQLWSAKTSDPSAPAPIVALKVGPGIVAARGAPAHPDIVVPIASDIIDGVSVSEMPYIDGLDLRRIMSRLARGAGPAARATALSIAWAVATILNEAAGWAHPDLAPRHVMLATDGAVKLVGVFAPPGHRRDSGYAAPASTAKADPTPADNVFSLGVILWEMLSARRLFAASDDWPAEDVRVQRNAPRLRSVSADVAPEVDEQVALCLSVDPARRPRWPALVAFLGALDGVGKTSALDIGAVVEALRRTATPGADAERTEPTEVPSSPLTLPVRPAPRTIEEPASAMLGRPWVEVDSPSPGAETSTDPVRLPTLSEIQRAIEDQPTQPVPAPSADVPPAETTDPQLPTPVARRPSSDSG